MSEPPVRYRIDRRQLGALLRMVDVVPDGRLLDPGLVGAVASESTIDDEYLDAAGAHPVPVLEAVLPVVASPDRILTTRVNVPGVDEWFVSRIAAGPRGGPYVMVAESDEEIDLLVLASEIEVAAMLDGFLDLTTLPARPVNPDVVMSFEAWVGTLAGVDARRELDLRAELEHLRAGALSLRAADLDKQLRDGLERNDTRWAITAFTPMSPVNLRSGPPTGAVMIRDMTAAGLIEPGPSKHHVPTDLGRDVFELVGTVIKWGALTLVGVGPDGDVRLGEVTIVRTPLRLGTVLWNARGATFEGTIVEPAVETAAEVVREMLLTVIPEVPLVSSLSPVPVRPAVPPVPPHPEPAICPSCGAPIESDQRFCAACGTALRAEVPEPFVVCPGCRAEVDPSRGRFCPECGTAVQTPPGKGG